jgi:hypothetical protein
MATDWMEQHHAAMRQRDLAISAARLWLDHYRDGGCKFRTMVQKVLELTAGVPESQLQMVLGWMVSEAAKVDERSLSDKERPGPSLVDAYILNTVDLCNNAGGLPKSIGKPENAYERTAQFLKEQRIANLTAVGVKGRYHKLKNQLDDRSTEADAAALNRLVTRLWVR